MQEIICLVPSLDAESKDVSRAEIATGGKEIYKKKLYPDTIVLVGSTLGVILKFIKGGMIIKGYNPLDGEKVAGMGRKSEPGHQTHFQNKDRKGWG